MQRRKLTFASVFFLMLATVTAVLWVRSFGDTGRKRLAVRTDAGRWYAITSERGCLVIGGPPRPSSTSREAAAREAIAGVRNDYFCWREDWTFIRLVGDWRLLNVTPTAAKGVPQLDIQRFFRRASNGRVMLSDVAYRPLLEALDDPNRFVAAHVLLVDFVLEEGHGTTLERGENSIACYYEGLKVVLGSDGAVTKSSGDGTRHVEHCASTSVQIDPEQIPAIRERWRAALEVPLAAIHYKWVFIVTLVVPTIWLGAVLFASWRRRRGLCPACGYDLRASGGTCPECGHVVKPAAGSGDQATPAAPANGG